MQIGNRLILKMCTGLQRNQKGEKDGACEGGGDAEASLSVVCCVLWFIEAQV